MISAKDTLLDLPFQMVGALSEKLSPAKALAQVKMI
jgi:hypothetical protein